MILAVFLSIARIFSGGNLRMQRMRRASKRCRGSSGALVFCIVRVALPTSLTQDGGLVQPAADFKKLARLSRPRGKIPWQIQEISRHRSRERSPLKLTVLLEKRAIESRFRHTCSRPNP